MAPYTVWSFVLIAIVVPPPFATEGKGANNSGITQRKTIKPLGFLISRRIYVNLTTRYDPAIRCIEEITKKWNPKTRILSKWVAVKSSWWWRYDEVEYKAVRKGVWVTLGRSENTTYTFYNTSHYCTIVKKETNKSGGHNIDNCELWVNEKFLGEPENEESCTKNFKEYCKHNATRYNYEDCRYTGKPILV
uniref:Putative group iv salivary lipocalin n=1 Tax=Rhipicephalus pulchellus TaxID=72859 RepID=L7M8R9_RHIPC